MLMKVKATRQPAKARMIVAALDLLRCSGLAGTGLNQVVTASGAPKGSMYYHFPGGKHQLVAEALAHAGQTVANAIREIFAGPASASQKVKAFFVETGEHLKESGYAKGCPVAAVTLDVDETSERLRRECRRVFETWIAAIAEGLADVPPKERHSTAELILSTLEGALIISRAYGSLDPIHRGAASIGEYLELKFAGT